MTPTEARSRAIAALTRRLADSGAPEPEVLAGELLVLAEAHGFRYRPEVVSRSQQGPRTEQAEELIRAARAAIPGAAVDEPVCEHPPW